MEVTHNLTRGLLLHTARFVKLVRRQAPDVMLLDALRLIGESVDNLRMELEASTEPLVYNWPDPEV